MVAGPGAGKTHNFRRVLEKAGGGLALTFIRALARDLDRDLGDLAQVNTFHGYCKNLAHTFGGVEKRYSDSPAASKAPPPLQRLEHRPASSNPKLLRQEQPV